MESIEELCGNVTPADAMKARVLIALEGHAERVAQGKGRKSYGYQGFQQAGPDEGASIRNLRNQPEPKPKADKEDFNKRTRDYYRALGYRYVRIDHYDTGLNRAFDFMGFADAIAMKPGESPILIQLTSASNRSTRYQKIRENKLATYWLQTGARIQVIGWKGSVPTVTEVRL